jgi:hypothetical protein
MKEIEREIEVLEHMIDLLNRCLYISLKNYRYKEIKSTLSDIQTCKRELRKVKARDIEREAQKEPTRDEAIKRC